MDKHRNLNRITLFNLSLISGAVVCLKAKHLKDTDETI